MKRKLIIVAIAVVVAIALSCTTVLLVKNLKKPTYEQVDFEITATLTPWQTMMVKTNNKYIPCVKNGNVYTASTKKIKGSFLRYTVVLADEWGNTYSDEVIDDAGEVVSQATLIKHTASFTGTLEGKRNIPINFTVMTEMQGEIYIMIDSTLLPLEKVTDNAYCINTNLGIGYHVYRCFVRVNGENIAELSDVSQLIVSKNNNVFMHHAEFFVDTSRSINLTMTFSHEIGSAYVIVEEHGFILNATKDGDCYNLTIDLEADCLISVVISSTDGLEGINYDSVYTAHTSTLSDNEEIFIELDGNFNGQD